MPEAIFAADRGYNSKETIEFVPDTLGATLIGTHKGDLWIPFVFGDGPITRRHRGMVVSEKGVRAVYSAWLKKGRRSTTTRAIEACVYRESCSGRIAAFVHNNSRIFPSRCFTVVVKEAFLTGSVPKKLDLALTVYDASMRDKRAGRVEELGRKQHTDIVLSRVNLLTYYQSEDPVWFLLRAFRFTSRTAHGFLSCISRDYDWHVRALSKLLFGTRLTAGSALLPATASETEQCLKARWNTLIETLGM